ncbi:hypothetical protein [Amycolatopsis eburnea]|uniref:Uncharacterized protein n=1 Tax=Amycolatopsis eburnea TaxID=2267691 RepID=A0A427TPV7_9PSEU|nr:hypothetical protein [Amycolatopsis eburnea]RSD26434.1 hypothetical protein EIY87_00160 [Amycolatopsis eburnea]
MFGKSSNSNSDNTNSDTCSCCSAPATTTYAGDRMCGPHAQSRQELDERPCFRLYGSAHPR